MESFIKSFSQVSIKDVPAVGGKNASLGEITAIKKVRNEMGLTNVKVMIPFCRTADEGKKVLNVMKENGLERGENALEVYVMVEIPSNVIEAASFASIFDGFSIGSNDLTYSLWALTGIPLSLPPYSTNRTRLYWR